MTCLHLRWLSYTKPHNLEKQQQDHAQLPSEPGPTLVKAAQHLLLGTQLLGEKPGWSRVLRLNLVTGELLNPFECGFPSLKAVRKASL